MSTQVTITLNEVLDKSVDRLPWLRRRVAKRRLQRPGYREEMLDEIRMKVCDDPECERLGLMPIMGAEAIGNDRPFTIDVDKLERLIQLFLKYAPKILEILIPLFTSVLIFLLCTASAAAQPPWAGPPQSHPSASGSGVVELGLPNPELEVVLPWPGGWHFGFFVVEARNISYRPELATNALEEFAVGHDSEGLPLIQNDGHIHGWVFEVDRRGRLIRNDDPPTPQSYFRFYGAGSADFFGNDRRGYYVLQDDLPSGRYRAFFQAQQSDHTAMRQKNAPAFPPICSVDFVVW